MHDILGYQHPHQVVSLLELMNLHGHAIVTRTPQLTGVVHSVGLEK